jgi:hypothetical protein
MLRRSVLVLLCLSCVAGASTQSDPPDLNLLLDRIIARAQKDEQDMKNGREIVADEKTVEDDLNPDGSVKEHNEYMRVATLLGGKIFLKTVTRNGQPLSGKYLDKERDREKKFKEGIHKPRKPEDDDLKVDREFLSRYIVKYLGEDQVGGRPCWNLSFAPKSEDLPERTKIERILNHVKGTACVDKQDAEIAKIQLSLVEPVSFYAIVGKLYSLSGHAEQRPVGNGQWSPIDAEATYNARVILTNVHQHIHSEYLHFRPRSELK